MSCFCYPDPGLVGRLDRLVRSFRGEVSVPLLLVAMPGAAEAAASAMLGPTLERGDVRAWRPGWLTQEAYDELLVACDLNLVRGEDSFVRAQWAGRPFLWQPYPQSDDAHRAKLDAFFDRYLQPGWPASAQADPPAERLGGAGAGAGAGAIGDTASFAADVTALARFWGGPHGEPSRWPEPGLWERRASAWRSHLEQQADLCTQLIRFVRERLAGTDAAR